LRKRFEAILDEVVVVKTQQDVIALAKRFDAIWASNDTIIAGFRDLCDAARSKDATTLALRPLADVIASRIGPAARGGFSVLSGAVDALLRTNARLERWESDPLPSPLTEYDRVELALNRLLAAPAGHVVVWLAYARAITDMRMVSGPVTFLRADWALPNAYGDGLIDFPERDELRAIRKHAGWLDELHEASLKVENRIVLVRVDLGVRAAPGALEEAHQRVEAILSIAVTSGGASWLDTDARLLLLDGSVRLSTGLPDLHEPTDLRDTFGMGSTAEVVTDVIKAFNIPLSSRSMPETLQEALASLREARMTEHRDVMFYGVRKVTPRIATALEDHAMELLAAALKSPAKAFADALRLHETVRQGRQLAVRDLLAPFTRDWSDDDQKARDDLEQRLVNYQRGVRLVSLPAVVTHVEEIRALPMSDLQRADFEAAFELCVDPAVERSFFEHMDARTRVLQARHRRVRNAINHGLPLNVSALHSVREYAERTSGKALNLALNWFIQDDDGPDCVARVADVWGSRMRRIDAGFNWAEEDSATT
jgi:hypothetical protein